MTSGWLTPFFQSDGRMLPWIRDHTFWALGRLPVARAEMLATLAGVKRGVFGKLDLDTLAERGAKPLPQTWAERYE